MQFLHHIKAGEMSIDIKDEHFVHLVKVRRMKIGSLVSMRNLCDDYIYTYKIEQISKSLAVLILTDSKCSPCHSCNPLHLLWAVIEPKIVEKTLPTLNELGIKHISFFYSHFSQRHFALSMDRMQKILINSSQQCGRSDLMSLELCAGLEQVREKYPSFYAFDFGGTDILHFKPNGECGNTKTNEARISVMVGPEGGFSTEERKQFPQMITLNDRLILRSESACIFLASIAKSW